MKIDMTRRQMNTTYSAPIELNLRIQKTMFPLVVTLTLLANAIFAVCGLSKIEGIYTLLVYLVILQLLFEIVDRRSNQIDSRDIEDDPDLQLPFFDNVLPYVAIWLLWWLSTTLLFHAMVVFTHGILAQLVLVLLLCIFVAVRYVLQIKTTSLWVMLVRFFLHVVSCVLTFFPTRDWAPQHTSWMATFVRVTLFFLASIAFNTIVANYNGRIRDNLVLVWWILITPFYVSLLVLPVLIGFVFFTQTKMKLIFEPKTPPLPLGKTAEELDLEKNTTAATAAAIIDNNTSPPKADDEKLAPVHTSKSISSSSGSKQSRSSTKSIVHSSTTTLQLPVASSSKSQHNEPARRKHDIAVAAVVAPIVHQQQTPTTVTQRVVKIESPRQHVPPPEILSPPPPAVVVVSQPKQAEKVSTTIELI